MFGNEPSIDPKRILCISRSGVRVNLSFLTMAFLSPTPIAFLPLKFTQSYAPSTVPFWGFREYHGCIAWIGLGVTILNSIKHGFRELVVVGDRVLVKPDSPDDRTDVGLYLPQTVLEKEKVQSGRIVATGPGIALPEAGPDDEEPWKQSASRLRYIPMQCAEDDCVIFLKKSAIEIKFDGENFLVIPQAAILLILRDIDNK